MSTFQSQDNDNGTVFTDQELADLATYIEATIAEVTIPTETETETITDSETETETDSETETVTETDSETETETETDSETETVTETVTQTETETETEIDPADIIADAANGMVVFSNNGCGGCHNIAVNQRNNWEGVVVSAINDAIQSVGLMSSYQSQDHSNGTIFSNQELADIAKYIEETIPDVVVPPVVEPDPELPPYDGPDTVAIYTDCNFEGAGGEIPFGQYEATEMLEYGVRNKQMSSIRVPPGYLATLFQSYNFGGSIVEIREDIDCLSDIGFDDTTGSIVVDLDQEAIDRVAGRQAYIDEGCAGCHGIEGQGVVPIDVAACTQVNCLNVYELAVYIADEMPLADHETCLMSVNYPQYSCAVMTSAYIANYFDTGEAPGAVSNTNTPLSRLSNEEFLSSARALLGLSENSSAIESSRILLPPQADVKGLGNDAYTQSADQIMLAGFLEVARGAADDFLSGSNSVDALRTTLSCNASISLDDCLQQFGEDLLLQAYGRELTQADRDFVTDALSVASSHLDSAGIADDQSIEALQFVLNAFIRVVLVSPDYLFFVENGDAVREIEDTTVSAKYLSSNEIAKRLSYFITGSLPDAQLTADANADLLLDLDVRASHIDRLLQSTQASEQYVRVINGWLAINEVITDDDDVEYLKDFLGDWFENSRDFSELYTGSIDVKNIDGSSDAMNLGILGSRAFVASHTSYPTPSFINRGEFVTARLLCGVLPEDLPDDAFETGALTNLQIFEEHSVQPCATCHRVFDNYGALFQQFDDETSLFDESFNLYGTSFDIYTIGDITGTHSDISDLSQEIGQSEASPACMSKLLYRHSMRRNISTDGGDDAVIDLLVSNWLSSGDTSIKGLIRMIALSDHFVTLYE